METWQLQDAKNKFSEVVEHALRGEPQMITRHGKPVVVITSIEDYEKTHAAPPMNFIEFLLTMPKLGDEWFSDGDPFPRSNGKMRDIDL